MPGTYNTETYQGDTFTRTFVCRDDNQDLYVFDGYTARMQLRTTIDAEDVALELTTENDRISFGDGDGTITLLVDAETMAAIEPGSYRYDLELVSGDVVSKLLVGKIRIKAEVTR